MTSKLSAAFPDHPPYSGEISDPHPHLTVAVGSDGDLDRVADELDRRLRQTPLRFRVDVVAISERSERTSWQWVQIEKLPLYPGS